MRRKYAIKGSDVYEDAEIPLVYLIVDCLHLNFLKPPFSTAMSSIPLENGGPARTRKFESDGEHRAGAFHTS